MRDVMRIFIGYDAREAAAYHVCQQSIIETARNPSRLAFIPVTGERRDGSNDFIYARFLVPYLCGFTGRAVFLDGDMLVRSPIEDLWDLDLAYVGCRVVKREYKTKHPVKYLGNPNEDYPRKNWSSVVLWHNAYMPNRVLTPEFVAKAPGSYLHRFQWLEDRAIGELPESWNRLVLEQPTRDDDALYHYTIGTPCFAEYADCDRAAEWHAAYKRMIAPC